MLRTHTDAVPRPCVQLFPRLLAHDIKLGCNRMQVNVEGSRGRRGNQCRMVSSVVLHELTPCVAQNRQDTRSQVVRAGPFFDQGCQHEPLKRRRERAKKRRRKRSVDILVSHFPFHFPFPFPSTRARFFAEKDSRDGGKEEERGKEEGGDGVLSPPPQRHLPSVRFPFPIAPFPSLFFGCSFPRSARAHFQFHHPGFQSSNFFHCSAQSTLSQV